MSCLIAFVCCQWAQHTVPRGALSRDTARRSRYLKQRPDSDGLRPSVCRTKSCQISHCSEHIGSCSWGILAWPMTSWIFTAYHDYSYIQSINKFISRHSTEARATVRLCWIKEKCLETDLKCVNGWSSLTVQWKRVPKSWSSNRETTSSSVQVVRRNWQKLLCGWSQQARLTVWADQISEVAWLLERSSQVTKFGKSHYMLQEHCRSLRTTID